MCRQVSSWVGDHQRIPAVDCFALFATAIYIVSFCMTMRGLTNVITEQRLQQITETSWPLADSSEPFKSPQPSHLCVTVNSGGCHGFQYLMSLEGPSKVDPEEDTIFAAGEDGKAEVVMDLASLAAKRQIS